MSFEDPNEFAGAFSPDGSTNFLGMDLDGDNPVDNLPDVNTKIPTDSAEVHDIPKKTPVGDVGKTLECLHRTALAHGATVDGSMEALFKFYCATEEMDTRDVELFIRGYMFATGSQVGPKITEATEALKVELRALHKANAGLMETIKLLANQATSVEREIASLSVNIKNDITSALQSAISGAPKVFKPVVTSIRVEKINVPKEDLDIKSEPNKLPAGLEVGQPSAPAESGITNDSAIRKMRNVMVMIGLEEEIVAALTDDDVSVVYPQELMEEYINMIDDEGIRGILREAITENIETRLFG